jgi:hypothetical protein
MNVVTVFDKVKPFFDKYRDEDHVEFEIRVGKFNCGTFDTNIGQVDFDKIMEGLRNYNGWERIITTHEEVFYRESDNLRISIDEQTSDEKIVQKERIHNENFEKLDKSPFDIRFSVSKEIPIDDYEGEMDKKKTKRRVSFIRKNLSIDMTCVTGGAEDMDTEDPNSYQIELEIIDPKLVESDNQLFNIIHKVKDLFNILDTSK